MRIPNPTQVGASESLSTQIEEQQIRYCIYARKSTEQDERQALSIDSQIKEMLGIAERDRLYVADILKEAHSAKASGERPVYNQLLAGIREGKFNGILTWAPDRLSRNAGDLGSLVDLIDQKALIEVRTYGQRFTNSPNEKFLLMILGAQGKLENDQKGLNVKRGQRARCEMGLWPAPAPTGYLTDRNRDRKCHVLVDPIRAPTIKQMFEKVANDGWSGRRVYKWLKEIRFTTPSGKMIWFSNVHKILNTPFYYGEFEYPKNSGHWYKGIHTPIISKDLYIEVQKRIHIDTDARYENKEFAFTRIMRCGNCDSGITAQEKFKKLKGGGTARYIYYGCTRSKNIQCKGGYIREEELIQQFSGIIDQVNLDELGMRKRLKETVDQYHDFQAVLGVDKQKIHIKDVDMKNYAKHILNKGSILEKRELLSYLKNKLKLTNKIVTFEK